MASDLIRALFVASLMVVIMQVVGLIVPDTNQRVARLGWYPTTRWSALPRRQRDLLIVAGNALIPASLVVGVVILSRLVLGRWDGWYAVAVGLAWWVGLSIAALRHDRRTAAARAADSTADPSGHSPTLRSQSS